MEIAIGLVLALAFVSTMVAITTAGSRFNFLWSLALLCVMALLLLVVAEYVAPEISAHTGELVIH